MNKRNIVVITLVTALVGAGVAVAGSGNCGQGEGGHGYHRGNGGMFGQHMLSHMQDALDLTDAQSETLENLLETHKSDRSGIHADRREMMSRALQLDPSAGNYDSEVARLADEVGEMARQRALSMAEIQKSVYAVLTPGQQDELRQMLEKRMQRKMKHHKHNDDA